MKMRQLLTISASNQILDHLNKERGLTDAEIARMIGVRANFIAMVRLRELPLTIDHVETMGEAFGMRLGAFLVSTHKGEPKTAAGKKWAAFCKKALLQADRVEEAIERSRHGRRTA